jgi:tight adherence protein C
MNLGGLLDAGRLLLNLDETGLAVVGGIAVFVTMVALGNAFVPHDPMAARLRSHRKRRERLRAEMLQDKKTARAPAAPGSPYGRLKRLVERLKLLRGDDARRSSDMLAQAGWRSRDALTIYMGLRLGMPFAAGILIFLGIYTQDSLSLSVRLLVTMAGTLAGGYLPAFGVGRAIKRRKDKIRKQVPDALDLLVICAESGLSLDAGVGRVARELGPSAPELADEFGLAAVELGFLPNRRQALLNLAKRVDLPSVRGVVNTLVQTERYGTPLAHALRILAAEFREERMMKAEEKAARLPATLTVPMIIFILPTLFIVLIGPAIIRVMDNMR